MRGAVKANGDVGVAGAAVNPEPMYAHVELLRGASAVVEFPRMICCLWVELRSCGIVE